MKRFLKIFSLFLAIGSLFMVTSCSKKVTVRFDANGGVFENGNSTYEQKYKKGTTIDLNSIVVKKEGYTLVGWSTSNTEITNSFVANEDVTLTANWKEGEVVGTGDICITYNATASGSFADGSATKQIYVNEGDPFPYGEIPNPNRATRLFSGWYVDDEYIYEGMPVTEDMEVKAKYKTPGENAYVVHYVTNGGTIDLPEEDAYYQGINYRLAKATKEGFNFLGWYENSNFSSEPLKYIDENSTGEKVLYACWEVTDIKYANVIFNEMLPNEVDKDLSLVSTYQGSTINWFTSDSDTLTAQGVINQTHKDQKVTITADIKVGEATEHFEKEVTVKAVKFEKVTNPVTGYFYNVNVTTMNDTFLDNFNIIYYAFAQLSSNGTFRIENLNALNNLMRQKSILQQHGIQIVLSINGYGGATAFSTACREVGYATVAKNIVDIVLRYKLDGVDVDWEFPTDDKDMSNLTNLCRSIKTLLNNQVEDGASPYLVTAAIPSSQLYTRFNLKSLNEVLDYVNMMSYDMNLEGRTSHLCPLLKAYTDGTGGYGIDQGIEWFTHAGLDKDKIIIGAAFYGKSYLVKGVPLSPKYPGLGAMAEYYTMEYASGTITYKYIYRNILQQSNSGFVRYYDEEAKVPYLYNDAEKIFITYEDEQSLIDKVNFAYQEGVGIMFWEYGYDYQNILTDTICNEMARLRGNN